MVMLKGGKYDGRDSSWVPPEYLETAEGRSAHGMPPVTAAEATPPPHPFDIGIDMDTDFTGGGISGAAAPFVDPAIPPPPIPPALQDKVDKKAAAAAAKAAAKETK